MRALLVIPPEETEFAPAFKAQCGSLAVGVYNKEIITLAQIEILAKSYHATAIITSSLKLLKLAAPIGLTEITVSNFSGSYFTHTKIPILIVPSLLSLVTTPYAPFLFKRYLAKIHSPESFPKLPAFIYTLADSPEKYPTPDFINSATFIAIDLETYIHPAYGPAISWAGFSFLHGKEITTWILPNPTKDLFALALLKRVCESPAEKIFQNGKYDQTYLLRFGITTNNWKWDTLILSYCLYSELPKNLAFITTLWVRESYNWKSLGKSTDFLTKGIYCGKDTYGTLATFLAIFNSQLPDYLTKNYLRKFPQVFPAIMCELTGIKRDIERTKIAQGSLEKEIASEVDELQTILGKGFNPNSPAQKLKLIKILGYKLAKNADEKALKKCAYLHPLNALIVGKILAVVKKIKLLSTYLTVGKEFNGRIIYSLDPTGTDTGRYSSRESSFWCGLQIHNIPRGKTVKQTLQSDPDFILCESDYEQAESRDVAYLSGSEKLINAVSGQDDFHSVNASAFFGVSYSSIRDNATGKTINKPLRDLAKRVNHGVTYVMGEAVLVDTMGWNAIEEARKLLKLPANWGYLKVAAYLINSYHRTYPELEAIYYPAIQREVLTTSKLTSQLGWTRYCFGKPDRIRAKTIYNSYVAHKSQSLNAEKLDMAFMKIFYSHMINPEKRNNIRVLAQIHDSLLFQVRKTHLHYCEEIKNAMEIPATITGADKKNRTYIVPASLKTPAEYWSDLD